MAYSEVESRRAQSLRLEGNQLFKEKSFPQAVMKYTAALQLDPEGEWASVYLSNRAASYYQLNKHTECQRDCRKAIDLNPRFLKPYYWLGRSLEACGLLEQSVEALKHAVEHTSESAEDRKQMSNEAKMAFRAVNKLLYLKNVERDRNRRRENRDLLLSIASEKFSFHVNPADDNERKKQEEVFADVCYRINEVCGGDIDIDVDGPQTQIAKTKTHPIPSEFVCSITLSLLLDPVITPSGHTYERCALMEHLEKVGNFDPVTRQPLYPNQIIPNLALHEAIDHFLDEHPDAWEGKDEVIL